MKPLITMQPILIFSIALLCGATVSAQQAPAPPLQQWGTIYGRILYDGPPPKQEMFPTSGKLGPDGPKELPDESLLVGKHGGLANVFVYVRSKPSVIHPDFEKAASKKQTLASKNYRYEPHALILWTHDELELTLADRDIPGNNFHFDSATQGFNILVGGKENYTKKLALGENIPRFVFSNIYPWMRGNLLVRDNPYFAITNERGNFCIPNLPAGEELEFVFYHERAGFLKNIKSDVAAYSTDEKGRLKTKLTQPVTDFGEYRLDPKMFEEQAR